MKSFSIIIILIILSFDLFAQNKNTEQVKLQLQWKYQYQFAGFIIAKEKGYYDDVGLDVDILESNDTDTMKELEESKIDFAITNSVLAYEHSKLNKVSLVATYLQRSPLVLVTQPEIKSVLDLKNKNVMLSYNNRYNSSLTIMFDYFDINNENTNFTKQTFNINDFIDKKVDAIPAFRSNELFILDKKNIPYNIIDPVEYGFATNAINLFVSHNKIKNNPDQIKRFLNASKKGWKYALDNIEKTAKIIHEKYQPNKSLENLIYEGKITKQLMLEEIYEIGEINKEFVHQTYNKLIKSGVLDQNQKSNELYYEFNLDKKYNKINFTKEEQDWIKNNPIVTYSEINWKPLSIIENNKMNGLMGSYLEIMAERTGIEFKFIPSTSWLHVLEQFKDKKIDLVPGIGSSDLEKRLGDLTKMYAKYPMVIVTNNDITYLNDLRDLKNHTVAVPKYYTSYNFIVTHYPDINIIATDNISEALLLVQEKKADAFIGHIATSLFYLSKLHLSDLKVSGTTKFDFEHHYLIQKNNPILLSILNKTFDSITHQDRNRIYTKWVQTAKIEQKIDYRFAIMITVFFTVIMILFIFWNVKLNKEVDKRIEAENLLQDTNDKFSALYQLSPLGLSLTDMDGNYIEFNDAFEKICGYTKKELESLDYWQLTPKKYEQEELQQLEKLKNSGAYGPYEKEYIRKDGRHVPINLNGVVVINSKGEKYIWSIVEDITIRKRDEQVMAQQSNLASMGEMIGNIAHQWRQPLSVISTGATGIKLQKGFGSLTDEYLIEACDTINNNAQYLSKTIDDFKDFVKGDGIRELFNLEKNIESFLSLVHGAVISNNINIVLNLDKGIELNNNGNELIQCLINIFNNAKDALADVNVQEKYFFITSYKKDNNVIIELKDNAGGINDKNINRVFEPYFTTKHQKQGTGIGLHMTYNLITSGMKGSIEVNNESYQYKNIEYTGAIFTIQLPIDIEENELTYIT